ncbi:hypothetical protein BLX91_13540 [Bacillus subtilis]|nr:hypothetical protein QF06_11785 [Bacillus sp. YP1]ALS81362.1 hypothetical protein AT706_05365 [Bacillus subtilis subsp. subtilis]KMY47405.1 hypothetical protein AC621_04500 [Bacillus sp. FJAT-27445]MBG9809299.1 hypothetical protein [Bacillus subtilis]PJM64087.1 hypothetical protein BLX91_13540 [Bacillus subtilis]
MVSYVYLLYSKNKHHLHSKSEGRYQLDGNVLKNVSIELNFFIFFRKKSRKQNVFCPLSNANDKGIHTAFAAALPSASAVGMDFHNHV